MLKLKISKKSILLFMALLPIFLPSYLSTFLIYSRLCTLITYLDLVVLVGWYVIKKRKPSKIILLIVALQVVFVTSTIFHAGDVDRVLRLFMKVAVLVMLFDIYSNNIKKLVGIFFLHFELCIYINFFTLLIYPNGLYSIENVAYDKAKLWFLGADNYFIFWMLPGLVVAWLYSYIYVKKSRVIAFSICVLISLLIQGSATGLVGAFGFIIIMYFPYIRKYINPKTAIIITGGLFLAIVIFRTYDMFEFLIVGILKKDMTFTTRLAIWDNAISSIIKNPILGVGLMSSDDTSLILGRMAGGIAWAGATHCHSNYLQIPFVGGCIATFFALWIYIYNFKCCVPNYKYSRIKQVLVYGLFMYLIIAISEPLDYPLMYILLCAPCFSQRFEETIVNSDRLLFTNRRL